MHRVAVEHALAKANDGNTDQGPVLKVRDSANQSIVGLVLHNHGRPKMIGAEGCSLITKRERFCVESLFKAAILPLCFGELPICPNDRVGATSFGALADAVRPLPNFDGAVLKVDCLAQPKDVAFSPWHSQ